MAKVISTIKAVLTRIIFSTHSIIAIWQVTENKGQIIYWALCGPLVLLLLEAIFTLMIKKTQEWRWFCPSVFLYLGSIVPAIWLLELDKVERRLSGKLEILANRTNNHPLNTIDDLLGETGITIGKIGEINGDTWITLIEQFLMLILIVGRWMLPKGDLTRDQLSQLLLVYIGTAADIIEFFDSYKDDSIAKIPLLVYLTLGIWSWSLLQFTIVLSATRARRPRGATRSTDADGTDCCNNCCCGIDIWAIVLNVILQDAPFLTFRLLIIFQYRIINYMNVFFTCKNSLVIILQLYRLYVVNAEFWKHRHEVKLANKTRQYKTNRHYRNEGANNVYMISCERDVGKRDTKRSHDNGERDNAYTHKKKTNNHNMKSEKSKKRKRKDTGYSTGASSQNLYSTKHKHSHHNEKKLKKLKRDHCSSVSDIEVLERKKKNDAKRSQEKKDKKKSKRIEAVIEETSFSSDKTSSSSTSTLPSYEVITERKVKSKRRKVSSSSSSSSSTDSSDNSEST